MGSLSTAEFAAVLAHVERLAARGNTLRMPASRALGDGSFELRFDIVRVSWRITYFFAERRRIVLLTVVPQATTERTTGLQRARQAMHR